MSYADIIRDNCEHQSPVSWWPRFAFHYTDVTNAVSILHSGYLYSRANVQHAFRKYQGMIKVCRSDMFINNGLYITGCQYHDHTLVIKFSESSAKKSYTERAMNRNGIDKLKPVTVRLIIDWLNTRSTCYHSATETQFDYKNTTSVFLRNLPDIPNAKKIKVYIYIGDSLMSVMEQSLEESELIK